MGEAVSQFGRFLVVGGVSTIAHYGALIALVEAAGTSPVVGSSIGALIGAIINYILNRRVTFRSNRAHGSALPRFMVIAFAAMVLNAGLMWLFVGPMALPYIPAQVLTTAFIILVTFFGNKFWSFQSPAKD